MFKDTLLDLKIQNFCRLQYMQKICKALKITLIDRVR